MSRILTIASGRIARFVVLGVWIIVLAGIGSLAGKLESAEKNESSSFLPGSAESSKVLKDIRQFPGGETAAAVILYRRDGGLTPRDLAQIQAARVPTRSRATAVSVCVPFAVSVEFQLTLYGLAVSSAPRLTPSSLNCTPATPRLSLALAETVTALPVMFAPSAGAVMRDGRRRRLRREHHVHPVVVREPRLRREAARRS